MSLVVLAMLSMSTAGVAQMRIQSRTNEGCWEPMGLWLGAVLKPDAVIAVSDAGAIPYYSRLKTLDIHPRSLLDRDIATDGFSVDRLMAQEPEAILLQSNGVYRLDLRREHAGIMQDSRFVAGYRHVGVTRIRWAKDTSYWVYLQNDVRLTDDQLDAFPLGVDNLGRVVEPRQSSAVEDLVELGGVADRKRE